MSEEKPTFKVTDRRLFNPDGSPREVERAEESACASESVIESESSAMPSTDNVTGAAASPGSTSAAAATNTAASAGDTSSSARAQGRTDAPFSAGDVAGDAAGDDNPFGVEGDQSFVNLVMFIASPAAAALGMTEHPAMTGRDIDLPLAKHCIDLLGTLQDKTRDTLSAQEQQLLEGLLAELRMQFVSLNSARSSSAAARGFTGSDITGGR